MRGGEFCTSSRRIAPGEAEAMFSRPGVRIPASHLAKMVGRPLSEVRPLPTLIALTRPTPPPSPPIEKVIRARKRVRLEDRNGEVRPMPERVRRVLARIARHYGVTVAEIAGPSRVAFFAAIRQEAYYEVCRICNADGAQAYSSTTIGRFFNRDHSTVLHGAARHRAKLEAA